jgi:TPR repeat protein
MFTGRVSTTNQMYRVHQFLVCLVLPVSLAAADREALEKQAATGEAEAQYQLAEAYFWGHGGQQNLEQAADWARLSAEQGNAKGEYRFAVQLILGQGLKSNNENDKQGYEWLAKASIGLQKLADQGDHDAQYKLALLYFTGLVKGEEDNPYHIDEKKVVDLVKKAANGENVSSQFRLSVLHRYGIAVNRSNEKSVEWLRKAADNGSVYAANALWMMFRQFKGQLVKLDEAKPYLKSAAKQGLATAQHQYGVALGEGLLGGIDQEAGIEWVKKAAEQGLDPAQLLLGVTLSSDKILDQDLESSFVWLSLASTSQSREIRAKARKTLAGIRGEITPAKQLDLQQQVKNFKPKESLVTRNVDLGLQGAGRDITFPKQVDLLTALADEGNTAAMYKLGEVSRRAGKTKESLVWLEKAAKKKNIEACAMLARIFLSGNNGRMEPDKPGGIKWLKAAAKLGDVVSMNGLGERILNREVKGVQLDEGVKWITKAANNGLASAQTNLGRMFINGDVKGIKQDFPKAKEWLLKAARQNFPPAQFSLGQFYMQGREQGKPNHQEAIKWYRFAARQGHARAQFAMGMMHIDGTGVEKSNQKGYKWLVIAKQYGMQGIDDRLSECAEKLNPNEIRRAVAEARQFRAQNYYHPNGAAKVEPIDKFDIETLQFKADRGDTDAQFQLAQRYAAGDGVGLDSVQAYKWFLLAEKSGHDKAKAARRNMARALGMTIPQRSEGQKLAKAFTLKDK